MAIRNSIFLVLFLAVFATVLADPKRPNPKKFTAQVKMIEGGYVYNWYNDAPNRRLRIDFVDNEDNPLTEMYQIKDKLYTYKTADDSCTSQAAPWTDLFGWLRNATYGGSTNYDGYKCDIWTAELSDGMIMESYWNGQTLRALISDMNGVQKTQQFMYYKSGVDAPLFKLPRNCTSLIDY